MRRNPYSTGYVAAKIRANTARRNGGHYGSHALLNGALDTREQIIQKLDRDMIPIPGTNFAMNKYETTQALYRAVMGAIPKVQLFEGAMLPVTYVSAHDAEEFCERLSELTGERYRLPTSDEWEYAARGGENYQYAGSNDPDEVAWTGNNSGGRPHHVGQLKPNGYGLFDMSGNVWEWTATESDGGNFRVIRGGSWYTVPARARVANRDGDGPSSRGLLAGFRIVKDL